MRTQNENKQTVQTAWSAEKREWPRHDSLKLCIWLVERTAQVSGPITEQSWVNPALLSSLHWKLFLEGKLGLHWLHSKQIYLLRSSSAPLNVNNHMGNFHGIQSLPNYSWRLPAENLIHFVSSLSTRNERKKKVNPNPNPPPPLPHPGWNATRLQAIDGSSSGLPKSLPDPIENPSRVKELWK